MTAAASDRHFTLRQVTAALDASFPCKLISQRSYDRQGVLRLTPVLLLELSETDYQALQDTAAVTA